MVSRTVRLPEDLDVEVKVLAAKARIDKSDVYELGAVVILTIARQGKAPAELLRALPPRHRELLSKIVLAARG